jgi:hypothetical protein
MRGQVGRAPSHCDTVPVRMWLGSGTCPADPASVAGVTAEVLHAELGEGGEMLGQDHHAEVGGLTDADVSAVLSMPQRGQVTV